MVKLENSKLLIYCILGICSTNFSFSMVFRNSMHSNQHNSISANNCVSPHHQCIPLGKCEYFGNLLTNGGSVSTVSNELSNLFCGHDGLGVLVRISTSN